jgi:DNA polymerase
MPDGAYAGQLTLADDPPLPAGGIDALRAAAETCRRCPLWARATQTVFGEGPDRARVLLVGEQPGDEEDLSGRPFVGPAGRLLDRVMAEAGIDRSQAYVTNAVKHFKWEPRGKRRIHQKPNDREVAACHVWLEGELGRIQPEILVCLGATAGQALLGKQFRVTRDRGRWLDSDLAPHVMATIHPSAILRADDDVRDHERRRMVDDLRLVADRLASLPSD